MDNANIFIRGQVWYWEDPTYGKKECGRKVTIGEGPMRHDRYVLIIQSEDTINHDTVLVIPLSHVTNNTYDVQVPMRHVYDIDVSFARVRMMMPVHIKTLKRYICTLPESTMDAIDARLLILTLPKIAKYPKDKLKSMFNIDMNIDQKNLRERINFTTELKDSIKLFIDTHIQFTNDKSDKVSIYMIKDLFDEFCSINSLTSTEDMIVFIDAFNCFIPSKNYQFSDYDKYNSYELIGIKVGINTNADKNGCNDDHKVEKKWDDNTIREFIHIYETDGVYSAAEHFHIKTSTVEKYYKQWKEEFKTKGEDTSTPIENVSETSDIEMILKDIDKIPKYVSKFGNYVRNWVKEEKGFNTYAKSGTKRNRKTESRFYEQLSNGVYFSILYLLNIEINNGSAIFNDKPSEDNPKLESWRLIYRMYTDPDFNLDRLSAREFMKLYREKYGENTGINPEWETFLQNKLGSYFQSSRYNVPGLCKMIKATFCQPTK